MFRQQVAVHLPAASHPDRLSQNLSQAHVASCHSVLSSKHCEEEEPCLSNCMCRHMRAVVNLALDALACKNGEPGYQQKRHQLMAAAMRLRYGLDDNKPRTLKEVSPGVSAALLLPVVCGALCRMLRRDLYH